MSNTTTSLDVCVGISPVECARLREFKDFLKVQINGGDDICGTEIIRNCVTRSSNETYHVNVEERQGEVIHTLWQQLQIKRCPYFFQIKLLRIAVSQLEQELRNAKQCNVNVVDSGLVPQYDLLKLQKFVNNHLEKLLNTLTDNVASDQLQQYADPSSICANKKHCNCEIEPDLRVYSVGYIKNKHRKMEDRHVCLPRYNEIHQLPTKYSFYGVFDGHSGALSATYATSQLPQLLAKQLQRAPTEIMPTDFFRDAFESAFMQTDKHFTQKKITSGTTAVCALLHNIPYRRQLYIAWVGDSKALLVGTKTRLQLVKSHKPDSPDERKRIEAAGGTVLYTQGQWRVNGILNVARSIGDYCVEPVIAEPDFVDVEITMAHDFLVLGTDGLWDHVTEACIVELIYKALTDAKQKFEDIPKLLIEAAKNGDSQDNITVIIVLLKQRRQIIEHYKQNGYES